MQNETKLHETKRVAEIRDRLGKVEDQHFNGALSVLKNGVVGEVLGEQILNLFLQVARWHATTFPLAPQAAPALKLVEEARELVYTPSPEEAADCLICLLAWLPLNALTLADLVAAAEAKLEVLRSREWVTDDRGVSQHIEGAQ